MRRRIVSQTLSINDDCTTLLVKGAEGPNSQLVSGHGASLDLGTHLTSTVTLTSHVFRHDKLIHRSPVGMEKVSGSILAGWFPALNPGSLEPEISHVHTNSTMVMHGARSTVPEHV